MDDGQPAIPRDASPEVDVDFDEVIDSVLDDLPEPFLERLGSVAIVVEDEASPELLQSVGARGLFGLYQGVPRTRFGVDNVPLPSKITLFRGPLTRANAGRMLARYPAMTAQVVAKIYWQALRLRLKGAPWFAHPERAG